ncbi:E3 ubiquitin-protein ligase HECTD3-like isoform X2 [Octopus vulgaris]|uniref:E3 ubiquitin-protein ligase HECTD3-like isoform X2 n=2 Tax=Octopus TaxID=6643 RepID=A0AA36FBQ6_OCTVU|nr:E3 ubiquitin-protein ligase HECTD3 [Octopus sinensis]CAI9732140.1 E3 ubiquitin-protein ligase HECTD3-like isoform X2 [Octopus vulgaris]
MADGLSSLLARIRCLNTCIQCLRQTRPLPDSLCYVPSQLEYRCVRSRIVDNDKSPFCSVDIYTKPDLNSDKLPFSEELLLSRVVASGLEFCNSQGRWIKVLKVQQYGNKTLLDLPSEGWILLCGRNCMSEDSLVMELIQPEPNSFANFAIAAKLSSWQEVVEHDFSVRLKKFESVPPDEEMVQNLSRVLPNWTLENDEALVQLMANSMNINSQFLGNLRHYVDSVDVSSSCVSDDGGPLNLTDDDPDTYWESEGSQNQHWIKLHMKKGTVIKELSLTLSGADNIYLPSKVIVCGGDEFNMKDLNVVTLERPVNNIKDICILEGMRQHYPIIMIKLKQVDGLDVRVRGLKIQSSKERTLGFDRDFFCERKLFRYPRLEAYTPDELYYRSIALQRFISLLDSVLSYIVPKWSHQYKSTLDLESIRQLLPLSQMRPLMVETFLRETVKERPLDVRILFINRRAATEHRADPQKDSTCKNTVFMQVFEGLKPKEKKAKHLNYRWPNKYDQWWECKFLMEGIIDQGGGFRDSLSDISEELCPSCLDTSVPLPCFIRSPNQVHEDSNVNRDAYIPNPSCTWFAEYEWIGQLMGACFRSKENLVLSLAPFVWKQLSGENLSWAQDFATVDAAEVKLLETLVNLDEHKFLPENRLWSTTLSDGTEVHLRLDEDGNPRRLKYDERRDYCAEVKKIRMSESSKQIAAIRKGLLQVIPEDVLRLTTWQELEKRVCGEAEITVEALQKSVHLVDLEPNDLQVKHFWEAVKNFSNEDRSRLLRFVTGRRRLPAPIYLSSAKPEVDNVLPESSTCGNMLFMPRYSSAKIAEEKLQYAAYNCIAIDTDVSPWED